MNKVGHRRATGTPIPSPTDFGGGSDGKYGNSPWMHWVGR